VSFSGVTHRRVKPSPNNIRPCEQFIQSNPTTRMTGKRSSTCSFPASCSPRILKFSNPRRP
jgi:hypothetical protein